MENIAIGSVVIVVLISIYGIYKVMRNITFRNVPDRYSYVTSTDEDGNRHEKVIDKNDNYVSEENQ